MFDTLQVPLATSTSPFIEGQKGWNSFGPVSFSSLSTMSRIQALGSSNKHSRWQVRPANGSLNCENGNPIWSQQKNPKMFSTKQKDMLQPNPLHVHAPKRKSSCTEANLDTLIALQTCFHFFTLSFAGKRACEFVIGQHREQGNRKWKQRCFHSRLKDTAAGCSHLPALGAFKAH